MRANADSHLSDGLDYFLGRFGRDGIEVFGRYVRAFHAGDIDVFESSIWQDGPTYVSVVSGDTWTREWGNSAATPVDATDVEYPAFVDGEVYSIDIQFATDVDFYGRILGWDSVDYPVYGYYGEEWAAQAATIELEAVIAREYHAN